LKVGGIMVAKLKLNALTFPTLQNNDSYFEKILGEEYNWLVLFKQYLLLLILSALYGFVMGSYHSILQAAVSSIKLPVLFTFTLIICFPAFFIIQHILGSKLTLVQMTAIIISGFVLTTAIMVSFIPVVIFFLLTGSNYYFLQLLHIGIFLVSGIFGTKTITDALKFSCEKKGIYPRIGVDVFKFWIIILAFVGIQLAWNLRPFLGNRGESFQMFREYEGNFYTALIYSVKQLVNGNPDKQEIDRNQNVSPKLN
jgi:hypothetical protein